MIQKRFRIATLAMIACAAIATTASAQTVSFKDPMGDDFGPGTYSYPTDGVYKKGSFDITAVKMAVKGDKVTFEVSVNSDLADPWSMGTGFAVQMAFIFIDTDNKDGSGFTDGLPGLNVKFAPGSAWEKCVILSPQGPARVQDEVSQKAGSLAAGVVVPTRTRGAGRIISATVDLKDLGSGDPTTWGYQVIMQSNEGFPQEKDILTRRVNEYEGQHRFGGGNDAMCDPHVMDLLAGDGKGVAAEVDLQKKMLAYECNADGTSKSMATLTMVHYKK